MFKRQYKKLKKKNKDLQKEREIMKLLIIYLLQPREESLKFSSFLYDYYKELREELKKERKK